MSQKLFSIQEIKNYLLSKDSMGDIVYYLSEENIIKANEPPKCQYCDEFETKCNCEKCDSSN
jgi:hypothetical protein